MRKALFQTFEKLAASCYQLEKNPALQQAWTDAPNLALENAMSLHIINGLAVGDVVPPVIDRKSKQFKILAFKVQNNNFEFLILNFEFPSGGLYPKLINSKLIFYLF